jgi:hypothetical protein
MRELSFAATVWIELCMFNVQVGQVYYGASTNCVCRLKFAYRTCIVYLAYLFFISNFNMYFTLYKKLYNMYVRVVLSVLAN